MATILSVPVRPDVLNMCKSATANNGIQLADFSVTDRAGVGGCSVKFVLLFIDSALVQQTNHLRITHRITQVMHVYRHTRVT